MAIRIRYTLDLNLARAAKRSFCATGGGEVCEQMEGARTGRDQGGGSPKAKWDNRVTRGEGGTSLSCDIFFFF